MSVFFRRRGPSIRTVAVIIAGLGDLRDCYATINGTKQYSAGTHEVNAGDTITFGVIGQYGTRKIGWVNIDGTEVLRVKSEETETYNWTVPNGISTVRIEMKTQLAVYGRITVTTDRSHTGGSN